MLPRRLLLLGAGTFPGWAIGSGGLSLRWRRSTLGVAAPGLDLFPPRIVERLKNGASVPYDFELSLWVGSRDHLRRRAFERFVVSYDLWEERFAVAGLRKPAAGGGGLRPAEVTAWCLRHIGLEELKLDSADRVWVRLGVRAQEPRSGGAIVDDGGINLGRLVDTLSQTRRDSTASWTLDAGPVAASAITREDD